MELNKGGIIQKSGQFKNKVTFLFWIYTAIVILLCILPINGSNSAINNIYIVSIRLDYLVHIFLFIPWMLLWKINTKISFQKSIIKTSCYITIGILFAFSAEGIQFYLPYRAFNINDLIANVSGVAIGTLFFIR